MKNIRYLLEAALLYALFALFRSLGVERASALGGWIGHTIGLYLPVSKTGLDNLRSAFPEKTEDDLKAILSGMWDNLGRIFGEYPHLEDIIINRSQVVGEEHLEAIGEHNPCVLISSHLANWELGPFYFNHRKGWPLAGIYREPNNPYVARLLDKTRLRGQAGSYIAKSSQGVRDMVRVLKRGERLGNLIDQKYNNGIMVQFFGRPAPTSTAFAQLAERFQCPLLPLQIERLPECRFRLTLHKPFFTTGRTSEDVVLQATQMLEEWIKEHPEQWLWIHRRWGKSPKL